MSAVPPSADPKLAVPNEQSAVPPSANRKSAVPDDTDTEEKTLEEVPQADAIGPDTDQISEYSEDDQGPNATITHSAGIYRRMRPLLRSRQVKGLFIANSVFIIINILLLVAILAFTVPIGITERNYSKESAKDVPCYYEWEPWGTCSATCYGGKEPPMKTRSVRRSSVVQARGKYTKTHPCPPDLLDREDKMPCNVHKCPISLNGSGWRHETYPMDPADPTKNCYHIRNIPLDDQLIHIDDVKLIKTADNCSGSTSGSTQRRSSHVEL